MGRFCPRCHWDLGVVMENVRIVDRLNDYLEDLERAAELGKATQTTMLSMYQTIRELKRVRDGDTPKPISESVEGKT